MKVSLHGTSNSIRKGWKEIIYKNEKLDITNFSIGACCSGAAMCQSLLNKSYKYDINILELSINDSITIDRGDLSVKHVKKYIDGLFELMHTSNSLVILLMMPEKTYSGNENIKNEINDYYRKKAQQYNIPIVDGYNFVNLLKEQGMTLERIFLDTNHLNSDVALLFGQVVNSLINFVIENGFRRKVLETSSNNKFIYLSAEKIVDNGNKLVEISTRLLTDNAFILTKDKILELKTEDFLCGLLIDTNNSEAIIKIEGLSDIIVNAYRSQLIKDKPQFMYIPLFHGLQCNGTLKISIVNNNTEIDEDSWKPLKVKTNDNKLVLFGLLFSKQNKLTIKRFFILDNNDYLQCVNLIEKSMKVIINNDIHLKIIDIVEGVKNKIPNIMENCDDKTIQKIVVNTIDQVRKEILESKGDKVNIPRLGRFRKKEVEIDSKKEIKIIFLPFVKK